jgi:hypothetical protein
MYRSYSDPFFVTWLYRANPHPPRTVASGSAATHLSLHASPAEVVVANAAMDAMGQSPARWVGVLPFNGSVTRYRRGPSGCHGAVNCIRMDICV